ncbi:exodeoxyribonuclease V subunit beta [Alcanivorax sp. JB21]|uniref:exodeoxyribonuclease V subunit beta n=1 Tax=Alcanivorax limicola TaxID=2874102 RepID=UPI001CBAD241|nr:exodeoxyribonuclease V subunit beta [Alcanivorax limicola]MBZ2188757.1 exodeoxyribonuclease V subunit beta [Alcanivorax limicola]
MNKVTHSLNLPQPLDLTSITLDGFNLIEASAGTGKTFSIAGLYLRLVLGVGQSAPIPVESILVVTFTRAAVAELRGRIRARLSDARQLFQRGASDDAFERYLLQHISADQALLLLERALTSMDNAAIFTIHGFCQRLLRQHALDLGAPMEVAFVEDDSALVQQAVADFWRRFVYGGPVRGQLDGARLVACFGTPDGLQQQLRPLLREPLPRLRPALDMPGLEKQARHRDAMLSELRVAWQTHGSVVSRHLQQACDDKVFNGRKLQWRWLQPALNQLDAWVAGEADSPVARTGNGELQSRRLYPEELRAAAKPERLADVPGHELLDLLPDIVRADELAPALERAGLLSHAREQVLARMARLKENAGQRGMDDLLSDVARALQGEGGDTLASVLATQYPVALVDEFQDTDPMQYRIFRTLYHGRADTALFMIGDPKQAIYRFRGADIHAYLAAREDCAPERRFTLGVNWRSGTPMVRAVNKLFASHDDPFVLPGIRFHNARAAGRADAMPLVTDDKRAALTMVLADPDAEALGDSKGRGQLWQAQWIAAEIRRLLGLAAAGGAAIGEQPLVARDIAVLVRGHAEARQVRDALAEQGLGCVYRGRQSVFDTAIAADLEQVLAALAEPENESLVRSALGTALFAQPPATLYQRFQHPQEWPRTLNLFHELARQWRTRGVMPALYHLFEQEHVLVRLRATRDGERQLTDLLHLCELLQQAAGSQGGPRELLHWFARQRQTGSDQDGRQLRLESEDNLVQVVTIHTSKGLQYPVTFVAGMWHAPSRAAMDIGYTDDEGPCVALDAERLLDEAALAEVRDKARSERLGEDMRLLYVALTRSIHRCYVMFAPVGQGRSEAALHHLLGLGADETDVADYRRCMDALAENRTVAWCSDMPRVSGPLPAAERVSARGVRTFSGVLQDDWRLTSYSGLTRNLEHPQAEHFEPAEISVPGPGAPGSGAPVLQQGIHGFPRGAAPGICLHGIFERIDFRARTVNPEMVGEQLSRHGISSDWTHVVTRMAEAVCRLPLAPDAPALGDAAAWQAEMEFMLPVAGLDAVALEQAVQLLPAALPRPTLGFERVAGMLRGFIDLVFVADERYFLVDFKSNWLGPQGRDYHPAALDAAMAEHRYDVQAMLYALALHRHLRQTLPDYDPARHFGGIGYLFLRGMAAPDAAPGQGVWFAQPDVAMLTRIDQLFGATADGEGT